MVHINEGYLQKMKTDNLLTNFSYNLGCKLSFCDGCALGKISRSKFPKGHTKSKILFEVIHSDLCGPLNCNSLGGSRYFVTFTDEYSGFTRINFLKSKSGVFDCFVNFVKKVEREFDTKIKFLRSDNGGEYLSKKFGEYLADLGIQRQLTIPKTPEQNGLSERLNRTLVEYLRCLLVQSRLHHKFWAEALSTVVYVRNRTYNSAIKGVPYEILNKNKPDVGHFRVFGSLCYYHIPKDERRKLDPKGCKAIFVGYCIEQKGYRLFDQSKDRIVVSRDVIFHEDKWGFHNESSNDGNGYCSKDFEFIDNVENVSVDLSLIHI